MRASNSSVRAYWNNGSAFGWPGDVGDQSTDQTGLDLDVELAGGKRRCGLQFVRAERNDRHDVVGEQPPEARLRQRPVVEVGPERCDHVDDVRLGANALRQQIEELPRFGFVDHREQLLELVDHDDQAVAAHPGGVRDAHACETVRSGQHRHELVGRDSGDLAERCAEAAEGLGPRLHQHDRHVGVVAPQPRDQPGLHRARLARPARADDRRERCVPGRSCDEPIDELLVPEEPIVVGLAERSQSEVGVLDPPVRLRPTMQPPGGGSRSGSCSRICSSRRRRRGDGTMPSSSPSTSRVIRKARSASA